MDGAPLTLSSSTPKGPSLSTRGEGERGKGGIYIYREEKRLSIKVFFEMTKRICCLFCFKG